MMPDRRCLLFLCMISKIYALLSGPRPSRRLRCFLLQETMWVFSPCVVVVRGVSTEAWHAVLPPRLWATGPSLCNSVTSHSLPLFYPLLVCLSKFLPKKKNQHRLSLCTTAFSTLGSAPTVPFGWPRSQMPLEDCFETPSVQPTLVLHIISLCFLVGVL